MPTADPTAESAESIADDGGEMRTRSSIARVRTSPWQSVALLVLDNLDELADKESAQQQFVFAIDELAERGAQIIATSRTNPARDGRFIPGLRSRLAGGLAAPLKTLGPHGRFHVLQSLAHARGMALADHAAQRLAGGCAGTVSQLAGALAELDSIARSAGLGNAIDEGSIDEASIDVCLNRRATVPLTLKTIAQRVAEFFRVKVSDLRGPTRRQENVAARCVAIYLSRTMTGESLQAIGRYFGGRDHATVLYNIDKVTDELAAANPAFIQAVGRLRDDLDAERARFASPYSDE
jgi:chromosomal replication initiator protein